MAAGHRRHIPRSRRNRTPGNHSAGASGYMDADGVLLSAVFSAGPQRQPRICPNSAGPTATNRAVRGADLPAHRKNPHSFRRKSTQWHPNCAAFLESYCHRTLRRPAGGGFRSGSRNGPGNLNGSGASAAAAMEPVPFYAGDNGDALAQNAPFHSLCALSQKTFCFLRVLVVHWRQEEPCIRDISKESEE